jgi:hypothetical protein
VPKPLLLPFDPLDHPDRPVTKQIICTTSAPRLQTKGGEDWQSADWQDTFGYQHFTKRIAKQRVTNRMLSLGYDNMQANGKPISHRYREIPKRSNRSTRCEMNDHECAVRTCLIAPNFSEAIFTSFCDLAAMCEQETSKRRG